MMTIGRFSVLSFALLFTSSVLLVCTLVLVAIRSRTRLAAARGIVTSAIVLVFAASTFVVQRITDRETELLAQQGMYMHYATWVFFVPAGAAALLTGIASLLFRGHQPLVILRWRLSCAAACIVFAVMNTANLCSPGWCGHFGFPLPYRWWSDAMLIMDGRNVSAGASWMNLSYDVLCLVGVVGLIVRAFRKTLTDLPAPSRLIPPESS